MNTKKFLYSIAAFIAVASLTLAVPVSAEMNSTSSAKEGYQGQKMEIKGQKPASNIGHFNMDQVNRMAPIVSGVVSSINGNTLTVSIKRGFEMERNAVGTTTQPATIATSTKYTFAYTVDATNAQIWKNNATTTLASVVLGDMVYVRGKITGAGTSTKTVVATVITDGVKNLNKEEPKKDNKNDQNNFLGDGQPIVGGTVSAVSSSTLTVTNQGNVTYTVDATNAKIYSGNASSTLLNVKVGDTVLVQGVVNGTSITASGIVDQSKPTLGKKIKNFFEPIASFFSRFFRF